MILRIALINSSLSCRMIVSKLNALLVDAGMETKCLEHSSDLKEIVKRYLGSYIV